ncbi:MAG: DUF4390 domain-containing protein [Nitrospirales bacterium]|nr:DUF4390 domain-containing protein [Nitrospirales bacterium]
MIVETSLYRAVWTNKGGVLKSWKLKRFKKELKSQEELELVPVLAGATEISAVQVRINNNEISVSASLRPDVRMTEDIATGLSKEIVFYIDLFRVWSIWPDEFVTGRKISRLLLNDPIKREYTGESTEGKSRTVKKFRDADSMIAWAMNITDLKIANSHELEAGTYFVKVTADSLLRKLPPVIGYFLFFVPEKEFSLSKDSPRFTISGK